MHETVNEALRVMYEQTRRGAGDDALDALAQVMGREFGWTLSRLQARKRVYRIMQGPSVNVPRAVAVFVAHGAQDLVSPLLHAARLEGELAHLRPGVKRVRLGPVRKGDRKSGAA